MLGYLESNRSAGFRSIHNNCQAMAALSLPGDRSDFDRRDKALFMRTTLQIINSIELHNYGYVLAVRT